MDTADAVDGPQPIGDDGMTRRERQDLAALVRRREKLAKERSKQLDAERKADVERQLATIFRADDERWAAAVTMAKEAVVKANAEVQRRCDEIGIPREFQPGLEIGWRGRSENTSASRRAELRKVAYTRVEADGQRVRMEIERQSVETQTMLLAGGLTTESARTFLEAMPTADQLMPPLDIASLPEALPFAMLTGKASE